MRLVARRRSLAAGLLTLALAAAACQNAGPSGPTTAPGTSSAPIATGSSAGPGETTITFLGFYGNDTVQNLIATFEKSHPNIKLEYQSVPFPELNQTIQSRLANGGKTPDVYLAEPSILPSLARDGLVLDLTGAVPSPKDVWLARDVESATVDGKLVGLPVKTSTQLLYYNKALLDKAGIAYPSTSPDARLTWAQLRDLAKKAQAAGAKWGFEFEQVSRYYQIQPLPESAGGGSGLTGEGNLTPDITNQGWKDAMDFYAGLHADGISPRGLKPEETGPAFVAGDIAFLLGGPHLPGIWEAAGGLDFPLGAAAHPYFTGGKPVTPTGAWSIAVNPKSDHLEAAIELARWLTSDKEGVSAFSAVDAGIPTTLSAIPGFFAAKTWKMGEGGTTAGELLQYELDHTAVNRPNSVGYVEFQEIMNGAFEDIRNGQDVTGTLSSAQTQLESAFSRLKP